MSEKSIKTCYICASSIIVCSEESANASNVKTTRKILLKYLLKNRDKSLYNTIANYVSQRDHDDLLCSIEFCTSCDQRAEKVGRLLLKLNSIQNKIDEEIIDTQKKIADASKLELPDIDNYNSKRKKDGKFLNTLRKFQNCVANKDDLGSNHLEVSLSPTIGVEPAQSDDVSKSESHETNASKIFSPAGNPAISEVLIRDSREDNDDGYAKDEVEVYVKEEDDVKVDLVELDDVSHDDDEDEEVIDSNINHLSPSISNDPLKSSESDSNDSKIVDITPPPVVEVRNVARSSNLPNKSCFRPSSSYTNQVIRNQPLIKVSHLTSSSSVNIQKSGYLTQQKSQQILTQQRKPQQYVIITQLQPSSNKDGSLSLPSPKIIPVDVEIPPEAINNEALQTTSNLEVTPKRGGFNPVGRITFKKKKYPTVYRCKICSFTVTNNIVIFEHHLRSHETAIKHFTCIKCPTIKFTTKQMYLLHMRLHKKIRSLKCNICDQSVQTLKMNDHLLEAHQVNSISCPYCSYCFGKYHGLLSHWKWHGNTPKKCVICPDSDFKTRKLLAKHFIEFHGIDEADVLFKCDKPDCPETFFDNYCKTAHMRRHEKKYECTVCGRCFSVPSELEKHSQMHTGKYRLLYPCDLCHISFRGKTLLRTHQRKEHNAPKIQCDQCEKSFFSECTFQIHIKRDHDGGYVRATKNISIPCPTCGKVLRSKIALKNHLLTHSDTKDYICSECGFQTRSKTLLTNHEKRHFGEKTHKCPHCPKIFLTYQILKTHIRVHTKERPFVCDICGADFNQRSAMTTHRKRHADTNFVPRGAPKKTSKRSN